MPFDLKKRRESLKLTLEDVGKMVGVGKTTVRMWEHGGISGMRIESLSKYANALQIDPMDIIDPDHKKKKDKTILLTTEVMKHLSARRQERVFGFALSQLEEDGHDDEEEYYDFDNTDE